jgi:hypothetical protein
MAVIGRKRRLEGKREEKKRKGGAKKRSENKWGVGRRGAGGEWYPTRNWKTHTHALT